MRSLRYPRLLGFLKNWVFAFLELGFWKFATEFYQNHRNLTNFPQNSTNFEEMLWKKGVLEIFRTGFLAKNWVFQKFGDLGFPKSRTGFFGFARKKSLDISCATQGFFWCRFYAIYVS